MDASTAIGGFSSVACIYGVCVRRLAEGVSARYRAKSQKGPGEIYRGEGGHVANGPWTVASVNTCSCRCIRHHKTGALDFTACRGPNGGSLLR